jgi:2Fe-2S ferredoxin
MSELIVQNLSGIAVPVAASQTLLAAVQAVGSGWMYACGGKGRCATCRLVVVQGQQNLGLLNGPEHKFRKAGRLKENERLTCQCTLKAGKLAIQPSKKCL